MSDDRKRCEACGERKRRAEFYSDASRADGVKAKCRDCYLEDRNVSYRARTSVALRVFR